MDLERLFAATYSFSDFNSYGTGVTVSDFMEAVFDFSGEGRPTAEQKVPSEWIPLELNLAATALARDPSVDWIKQHELIYTSCIVDVSSVTGESYFFRTELAISELTVGEVVTDVNGVWSPLDPVTLDPITWAFDLSLTGWNIEQSTWSPTLTVDGWEDLQLALIADVLFGINHGYMLVFDSTTYPSGPSCVQSSYSLDAGVLASSTSLPQGTVGAPYSVTLPAGGGMPPYRWTIVSGALPDGLGLALNESTSEWQISGTPALGGTWEFTVEVTGSLDPSIKELQWVTITTTSLPSGTVGVAYNNGDGDTLAEEEGTGTPGYTWAVDPGLLYWRACTFPAPG